jgi:hypothetical protein
MASSHQGIDTPKGEEQPTDKRRARTSYHSDPDETVSRETRDPKQENTPSRSGADQGGRRE